VKSKLTCWIVGIVVVLVLAALIVPGRMRAQRADDERNASWFLKTLASAEADFRGNDRDRNGVPDFWTGNVSGLFDLVPPGATEPIGLMEPGIAGADTARADAAPFHGYWFFAMDRDEEGKDYRRGPEKNRHPSKFGFGAFPARSWSGRSRFYINEGNTVFMQLQFEHDEPPLRQWFPDGPRPKGIGIPGG
jgi:hypothetical protein